MNNNSTFRKKATQTWILAQDIAVRQDQHCLTEFFFVQVLDVSHDCIKILAPSIGQVNGFFVNDLGKVQIRLWIYLKPDGVDEVTVEQRLVARQLFRSRET